MAKRFELIVFDWDGTLLDSAGAIVVSHAMGQLRELCNAALLIEEGRLHWFDNLEEAIDRHEAALRQ